MSRANEPNMAGVLKLLKAAKDQDEVAAALKSFNHSEQADGYKEELIAVMVQKKEEAGDDNWATEVVPLFMK